MPCQEQAVSYFTFWNYGGLDLGRLLFPKSSRFSSLCAATGQHSTDTTAAAAAATSSFGEEPPGAEGGGDEPEDESGQVETHGDLHAVYAPFHLGLFPNVHGTEDAREGRPEDDQDPVPREQKSDGPVLQKDTDQTVRDRRDRRQRTHHHGVDLDASH